MARELLITVYLFAFRMVFTLFKLFPFKKKTTFIASFGGNVLFTLKELEKQQDDQIIILKTAGCKRNFEKTPHRKVICFKAFDLIGWFRSTYHLATSDKIFVDNYYGILAVTEFRQKTECIQLWHAAGAIKQFGLKDLSIGNRSPKAYERFKRVYQRFNHVVVGSEKMAAIFREGFGISKKQILRTGIPRTDFFFDSLAKKEAERKIQQDFPLINGKKVILYAPTYREHEFIVHELMLDIDKMSDVLDGEYVLLLSLHPAVKVDVQNKYPHFIFDVSSYNINHILVITDILISDYSSVVFEFSLLHRPMVFFAYDLDEYANTRGFWENYEELVPGPVVENTDDLIKILLAADFDMEDVRSFAAEWNQYSKGKSSENLIKAIYTEDESHV